MIDDDRVAVESVVDPMVYLRFKIGFSTKQQTPLSPASPAIPRGYPRGYPADAPRLGKQFGPGKVCRLGHQHRPNGPDFSDVTWRSQGFPTAHVALSPISHIHIPHVYLMNIPLDYLMKIIEYPSDISEYSMNVTECPMKVNSSDSYSTNYYLMKTPFISHVDKTIINRPWFHHCFTALMVLNEYPVIRNSEDCFPTSLKIPSISHSWYISEYFYHLVI